VVSPVWNDADTVDFTKEVRDRSIPELGGYVRTTLKEEASLHLFVDESEPILASWRYGLGRVIAFASDADGRWSSNWILSENYGQFWAQLVRWIADRPVRDPWVMH